MSDREKAYTAAAMAMVPLDDASDEPLELFEWHRCPECPSSGPCPCSGVPYPSPVVRAAIDAALVEVERERDDAVSLLNNAEIDRDTAMAELRLSDRAALNFVDLQERVGILERERDDAQRMCGFLVAAAQRQLGGGVRVSERVMAESWTLIREDEPDGAIRFRAATALAGGSVTSPPAPDARTCVCVFGEGCDAEGEPGCGYCRTADPYLPCPADDAAGSFVGPEGNQ